MTSLKKLFSFQKISIFLSIIACCLSVFSIISVNKIKHDISNGEMVEKRFKPIKDIPDVEVIKADGSITKITAKESNDELSKILSKKNENNKQNNNKNDKKNVEKKKNDIIPVSRDNKNTIKSKQSAKDDKKNNNLKNIQDREVYVEIKNKIEEKKENKENIDKIHGAYVIQAGAYKDKNVALKQCQKFQQYLNGKHCNLATNNNLTFRVILYPFNTKQEAENFANKFKEQAKVDCLVKQNA